MIARLVATGAGLLLGLFPLGALAALVWIQGEDALRALQPLEWAMLLAGLSLQPALLFLALGLVTQRSALARLGQGLAGNTAALAERQMALEALLAESRNQTALVQEQVRLALSELAVGKRQAELFQAGIGENRLHRLTAEWDLVVRELNATLAAMYRLVFGWKTEPPEGSNQPPRDLPLPAAEELPLVILRLLPASAEEMAALDVDERFVRQAARYRATFLAFLEGVPPGGPLGQGFFRGLVHGRLDARLALLPRPDHGRVVAPGTLAAE